MVDPHRRDGANFTTLLSLQHPNLTITPANPATPRQKCRVNLAVNPQLVRPLVTQKYGCTQKHVYKAQIFERLCGQLRIRTT